MVIAEKLLEKGRVEPSDCQISNLENHIHSRRIIITDLDRKLGSLNVLRGGGYLSSEDYRQKRSFLVEQRRSLSSLQSQYRNKLRPLKRTKEKQKSPY